MRDALRAAPVLTEFGEDALGRLESIATRRSFSAGEHIFALGDEAETLFVVLSGAVDLCLPLSVAGSVKEVCVDTKEVGDASGWSALVSPYRYRLSARAGAGDVELAAFDREALLGLFEQDPRFGYRFMAKIAEVIARRLLTLQALWARELQRAVSESEGGILGASSSAGAG